MCDRLTDDVADVHHATLTRQPVASTSNDSWLSRTLSGIPRRPHINDQNNRILKPLGRVNCADLHRIVIGLNPTRSEFVGNMIRLFYLGQ